MTGWRSLLTGLSTRMKRGHFTDDLCRYNPLYYSSVRGLLDEVDRMGVAERVDLSARLLARTLASAARLEGRPQESSLASWPILEKAQVRGCEDRFRDLRVLAVPAATSGTTGMPLRLWRSLECIAAEQAFWDHLLAPYGITGRTAKVARVWGDDVKPPSDRSAPFWVFTQGGRRLVFSSRHLSPHNVHVYADMLDRFRPDLLIGYPSALAFLAEHLLRSRTLIAVPIVITSAEVLHPVHRGVIRRGYGGVVIDQYGSAERLCFCTSMEPGRYLFHPAYGRVELRPCDDAAPPGYRYADIIATGFWNQAMPLVRFRTNDRVLYPDSYGDDDLAQAAMGLKPVSGIAGRDGDFLISPRGERLVGVDQIPRDIRHVFRVQLVQEDAANVLIRVVPAGPFGAADRQELLARARMKIPDDMAVRIDVVERLECLPSGKSPFVIRRRTVSDLTEADAGRSGGL